MRPASKSPYYEAVMNFAKGCEFTSDYKNFDFDSLNCEQINALGMRLEDAYNEWERGDEYHESEADICISYFGATFTDLGLD
tara:strand:+ start:861 stop:1106 length:246 start_codon:yes stop_codon:yes gene_type:complete